MNLLYSKVIYLNVKNTLVKSHYKEKNFSGYTNYFGWGNGVAHCADALDELVGCEECTENIALEVLEAIKNVFHNKISIFSNESILFWIESLMICLEIQVGYEQYISKINSRIFF